MSGSPASVAVHFPACGSKPDSPKLPAVSSSESFAVGDAVTLDGFEGPPLLLKLNGATGVVVHEVDESGWMFVRLDSDESMAKLTKVKPKHLLKAAEVAAAAARDDGHARVAAALTEFVGDRAPTGPIVAELVRRSALEVDNAAADNTAHELARSIIEETLRIVINQVAAEHAVVAEATRAGEGGVAAARRVTAEIENANEENPAEFQNTDQEVIARDSFTGDDGVEPPWYMEMCSCFGPHNWAIAVNRPIEVM